MDILTKVFKIRLWFCFILSFICQFFFENSDQDNPRNGVQDIILLISIYFPPWNMWGSSKIVIFPNFIEHYMIYRMILQYLWQSIEHIVYRVNNIRTKFYSHICIYIACKNIHLNEIDNIYNLNVITTFLIPHTASTMSKNTERLTNYLGQLWYTEQLFDS